MKFSEAVPSDFQYAGYYYHVPSRLNLTLNRAYSSSFGRWINRDPIGEGGGINLYAYVQNNPINFRDPSGLQCGVLTRIPVSSAPEPGTINPSPFSGEPFPFFGGPQEMSPDGRYIRPPNVEPWKWEAEYDITNPDGFKKCIDDIYKKLPNMCFGTDDEKQKWIKDEVDKCKQQFGKPTGNLKEIHGGDNPLYYDPETGQFFRRG